jgi:hypothetical protein
VVDSKETRMDPSTLRISQPNSSRTGKGKLNRIDHSLETSSDASIDFEPGQSDPKSTGTDLAIAIDGSFVETTSEAAAWALAKYYQGQQDGIAPLRVISRIEAETGRTIYRIRPRSIPHPAPSISPSSPHDSFDDHSPVASTSQLPALTFTNPTPQKSQRQPNKLDSSGHAARNINQFLRPEGALRRIGSTPAFSNASRTGLPEWKVRAPRRSAGDSDSDVLSRLLGWSTPPQINANGNLDLRNDQDLPQDRKRLASDSSIAKY